jgi:hypothetical protein
MATRYTDEFWREAVRIAISSGLTLARQSIRSIVERGDAGIIRFGRWPFDSKQVGSATSGAQQGIAQQCPERGQSHVQHRA